MTRKIVGTALLAMLLAATSREQTRPELPDQAPSPKPVSQQPPSTIPLSAGTAINASLVSPLDSRHSKPGDTVTATVSEAVVYQRCVLLPKGSRIVGQVVRTGSDTDQGSAIFVEFDKVILQNGQEALLNAGIQALAPPNAPATIDSRKEYEKDWVAGNIATEPVARPEVSETMVLPSTYTAPRKSLASEIPEAKIEGGLDHQGRFTPDSKGAFDTPNMRIFTPVSEGSHGTVLVGAQKSVRLLTGTRLLIVIQPPAASPEAH